MGHDRRCFKQKECVPLARANGARAEESYFLDPEGGAWCLEAAAWKRGKSSWYRVSRSETALIQTEKGLLSTLIANARQAIKDRRKRKPKAK